MYEVHKIAELRKVRLKSHTRCEELPDDISSLLMRPSPAHRTLVACSKRSGCSRKSQTPVPTFYEETSLTKSPKFNVQFREREARVSHFLADSHSRSTEKLYSPQRYFPLRKYRRQHESPLDLKLLFPKVRRLFFQKVKVPRKLPSLLEAQRPPLKLSHSALKAALRHRKHSKTPCEESDISARSDSLCAWAECED